MNWFSYAFEDLKRQKVKAYFGIGGVAISICLLTIIGSLSDSLSFSYLDQSTSQVGSSDIVFTKVLKADINFDLYFDEGIIEQKLSGNIEEINAYFARILMLIQVSHQDRITSKNITKQIIFYGLNTTHEQDSGQMGDLWLCDDNLTQTEDVYEGPVPSGHCIVTKGAAKLFAIKRGDTITVKYGSKQEALIVDAIVIQDTRFTVAENTLVITELQWAQSFLNQQGRVNYVMATLNNREQIYDTRDVDGTARRLRLVGEKIQDLIGFDYSITLPKMEQISMLEQTQTSMNLMFTFLTIFSMMITGILINSILSTSVEERIREFGIMRVVGSYKDFTVGLVLITGFLIAVIGTTIGLVVGAIAAPVFMTWIYSTFTRFLSPMDFIILPTTILQSGIIGIGVTTLISIFPALKAGKIPITKAIDPTRSGQKDEYHFTKEGSVSTKLMAFGIGIATMGLILFVMLPRIISSSEQDLVVGLFVLLLMCVLMGLVFACVGIVPLFERVISLLIKPIIRKYYPVYQLSLSRYRRRNMGSVVMFALTFAFIFFVSTYLEMNSANTASGLNFKYGSNLVMANSGSPAEGNAVTLETYQEITELPGVTEAAMILHNSIDITKITSLFSAITEGGIDFSTLDFNSIFGSVPKLQSYISDVGGFNEIYCGMIGINEMYPEVVDDRLIMWDTGSSDAAFDQLFSTNDSCIIAKALADELQVSVGDMIKVTFCEEDTDEVNATIALFKVAGISKGMPGVYNFRSSSISLYLGLGVMLNIPDYCKYMQYGSPSNPNLLVDKILLNLVDDSLENVKEVQTYIKNYYGETLAFTLEEAESLIKYMEESQSTVSTVLNAVLFFSIIISLFGLISSMYATLLERMYEIGILRAMGLKSHEMRGMLMAEAFTIMLSSGSLGMWIGVAIAYLLIYNVSLITEVPVVFVLNLPTLISTFAISILVSLLGMYLITGKVSKWSIVEILRHTF